MPAQDDLRGGLAVLFAQRSEQRLIQQRLVSMTQRIPCLRHDAVFFQQLLQLRLLIVGMQLGLQNGGTHLADTHDLSI